MQVVFKVIIIVLLLNTGCISKKNVPIIGGSEEAQIISKLVDKKISVDFFIYNQIDNGLLLDFLNEQMQFDESGHYHKFDPLRQWFPDSMLDSLFTKDQV